MVAKKLMPIHLSEHLKALDHLADLEKVDQDNWILAYLEKRITVN